MSRPSKFIIKKHKIGKYVQIGENSNKGSSPAFFMLNYSLAGSAPPDVGVCSGLGLDELRLRTVP